VVVVVAEKRLERMAILFEAIRPVIVAHQRLGRGDLLLDNSTGRKARKKISSGSSVMATGSTPSIRIAEVAPLSNVAIVPNRRQPGSRLRLAAGRLP
jgi:hypothetical protein